jgi:hypothetical protein
MGTEEVSWDRKYGRWSHGVRHQEGLCWLPDQLMDQQLVVSKSPDSKDMSMFLEELTCVWSTDTWSIRSIYLHLNHVPTVAFISKCTSATHFDHFVCLFIHLLICLFICLFVYLFIYLFVSQSIHFSFHPCLYVYLFILFVYLFIYLFSLSFCLSIYLFTKQCLEVTYLFLKGSVFWYIMPCSPASVSEELIAFHFHIWTISVCCLLLAWLTPQSVMFADVHWTRQLHQKTELYEA